MRGCSHTAVDGEGAAGCAPPLGLYGDGWAPVGGSQSGARARLLAPCAPTEVHRQVRPCLGHKIWEIDPNGPFSVEIAV